MNRPFGSPPREVIEAYGTNSDERYWEHSAPDERGGAPTISHDQRLAANTWNAAVDAIAALADHHYQSGEIAAVKRNLWTYDTDIGALVRSLRQPPDRPA
jgi:hypothetical protein